MPSKKQIVDATILWASRLKRSDESRLDPDLLGYLVEQVRCNLIHDEYNVTGMLDQVWFVDFGLYQMTKVNFADEPSIDFCACDIVKTKIPAVMNLTALGEGNLDLGLKVLSACGKTSYFRRQIDSWRRIPKESVLSKFHYYDRLGVADFFANKLVNNLRFIGIPETTDGLMIKETLPIISGSLKSGYVYMVKGTGSVTYNGTTYLPDQTFTANSTKTFTATGTAQVFYQNFEREMTDRDPFPVSNRMARDIVISILSTELQIEKQEVADTVNDSLDDALK